MLNVRTREEAAYLGRSGTGRQVATQSILPIEAAYVWRTDAARDDKGGDSAHKHEAAHLTSNVRVERPHDATRSDPRRHAKQMPTPLLAAMASSSAGAGPPGLASSACTSADGGVR